VITDHDTNKSVSFPHAEIKNASMPDELYTNSGHEWPINTRIRTLTVWRRHGGRRGSDGRWTVARANPGPDRGGGIVATHGAALGA
jgi:hypothetical protein